MTDSAEEDTAPAWPGIPSLSSLRGCQEAPRLLQASPGLECAAIPPVWQRLLNEDLGSEVTQERGAFPGSGSHRSLLWYHMFFFVHLLL